MTQRIRYRRRHERGDNLYATIQLDDDAATSTPPHRAMATTTAPAGRSVRPGVSSSAATGHVVLMAMMSATSSSSCAVYKTNQVRLAGTRSLQIVEVFGGGCLRAPAMPEVGAGADAGVG